MAIVQKKVSIVVPVYKVEDYLSRCVESLLNQTYRNIEIILVDDGSPDNCPQLCDEYAVNDSRVIVIHKKNGGLSDARNSGIGAASGKYLVFVDSDDWVHAEFIETLVRATEDTGADVAVCGFQRVTDSETSSLTVDVNTSEIEVCSPMEAIKDILSADTKLWVMTWNKLYKKSLFTDNKILFPVGKLHEDNFTTYKLFFYAHKVARSSRDLYYYLQRDDSIMGQKFNSKRYDALEAVEETRLFARSKKIDIEDELGNYWLLTTLSLVDAMGQSRFTGEADPKSLRDKIRANVRSIIKNPVIKRSHKVMALMAVVSPPLYYKIKFVLKSRAHK